METDHSHSIYPIQFFFPLKIFDYSFNRQRDRRIKILCKIRPQKKKKKKTDTRIITLIHPWCIDKYCYKFRVSRFAKMNRWDNKRWSDLSLILNDLNARSYIEIFVVRVAVAWLNACRPDWMRHRKKLKSKLNERLRSWENCPSARNERFRGREESVSFRPREKTWRNS